MFPGANAIKVSLRWGRSGGQVVSVIDVYSDDPYSNPVEGKNLYYFLGANTIKVSLRWGSSGGQVVSVLYVYSDDLYLNPAEGNNLYCIKIV